MAICGRSLDSRPSHGWPGDYDMGMVLQPDKLRFEMTRRGLAAADLARESHISPATVSSALAGRPVATKSAVSIARALSRIPVVELIDSLLPKTAGDFELQ
jgi:lambda repressor-like predicted transcriptional regulator